jgi:hypothetical protein
MTDEATKSVKKLRKRSVAKEVRQQTIYEKLLEGKTETAIAEEMDLARCTVSRAANSDDVKKLIKENELRFKALVSKAVDTIQEAMERGEDMNNGLKAAIAVLKSVGIVREKVDLAHSFPRPTVIQRLNGDTVVLGTEEENE